MILESNEKLRECPFCGSTDVVLYGYPDKVTYNGQRYHFVKCNECHCQTQRFYAVPEKAVKCWNRRTNKIVVHNGENYEVVINGKDN